MKREFRVMYKSNGVKPRGERGPVQQGMHARISVVEEEVDGEKLALEDAAKAVATCKKWFNETKEITTETDESGFEMVTRVETKRHVIVDVWVEDWVEESCRHRSIEVPEHVLPSEPEQGASHRDLVKEVAKLQKQVEALLAQRTQLVELTEEEEEEALATIGE